MAFSRWSALELSRWRLPAPNAISSPDNHTFVSFITSTLSSEGSSLENLVALISYLPYLLCLPVSASWAALASHTTINLSALQKLFSEGVIKILWLSCIWTNSISSQYILIFLLCTFLYSTGWTWLTIIYFPYMDITVSRFGVSVDIMHLKQFRNLISFLVSFCW